VLREEVEGSLPLQGESTTTFRAELITTNFVSGTKFDRELNTAALAGLLSSLLTRFGSTVARLVSSMLWFVRIANVKIVPRGLRIQANAKSGRLLIEENRQTTEI
jgi:hypothetical protein